MSFDTIDFLERAVQIPSHDDPTEMREFLASELRNHGFTVSIDEAGNTVTTRGEGSPHIVLNTHIDTVSPHVPFRREGDIIYGRGACDAKASLAVLLSVFLQYEGGGKITLAITPDEETSNKGASALEIHADGYIVGEPTGLDICNAAKGRFEAKITASGVSSHAAQPDDGDNAIRNAVEIIEILSEFSDSLPIDDYLGSSTMAPTILQSGEASNQIPSESEITVDYRSVPPETSDQFKQRLEDNLSETDFNIEIELNEPESGFFQPFLTEPNTELVRSLLRFAQSDIRPFAAATEASFFAEKGPTVIFGPGDLSDEDGPVAHSDREHVDIKSVNKAVEILKKAINSL